MNKRLPADPALCRRDQMLASMSALAGTLAHDFNNALVPIFGYLTMIQEHLTDRPAGLEYANRMEKAARKTETSLAAVLTAVRPQRRFMPRQTDLTDLIRRTVDSWKSTVPEMPAIELRVDLAPCDRELDPALWTRIVEELLNNSRLALPQGGAIELQLTREIISADHACALGIDGSSVFKFTVRDNGCGMPEEVLARACEPLFTTRGKGKAAGLGLTAVHSAARLHEGQFVLESSVSQGTTATVWLPEIVAAKAG